MHGDLRPKAFSVAASQGESPPDPFAEQEKAFFYHKKAVACEALDPGSFPSPAQPMSWQHILQDHLPTCPGLRALDSGMVGMSVGLRPPIPATLDPGRRRGRGRL